jgi:hypothetical protein
MKKTSMLTQLAIAGIAAGLVTAAPAYADSHGGKKHGDTAKTEKSGCKAKSGCKGDSACKGKSSCSGPGGCGASPDKKDASLGKKVAVTDTVKKASCKGQNSCKGKGGCAMTEKQLQERAKKLGIPAEKAGKAHSCKGKNECKGLGGCNM